MKRRRVNRWAQALVVSHAILGVAAFGPAGLLAAPMGLGLMGLAGLTYIEWGRRPR